MRQYETRIAELQQRILDGHARLERLGPQHEGYPEAARAVLMSTFDLIEYEGRLPQVQDEPRRAASLRTVRYSGYVSAVAGVAAALAVLPGWVEQWWLLLIVPVLLAAAALLRAPVPPAGGRHAEQADAATAIAAGAIAVPWLGLGAVAWPILLLVLLALGVGVRQVLRVGADV